MADDCISDVFLSLLNRIKGGKFNPRTVNKPLNYLIRALKKRIQKHHRDTGREYKPVVTAMDPRLLDQRVFDGGTAKEGLVDVGPAGILEAITGSPSKGDRFAAGSALLNIDNFIARRPSRTRVNRLGFCLYCGWRLGLRTDGNRCYKSVKTRGGGFKFARCIYDLTTGWRPTSKARQKRQQPKKTGGAIRFSNNSRGRQGEKELQGFFVIEAGVEGKHRTLEGFVKLYCKEKGIEAI